MVLLFSQCVQEDTKCDPLIGCNVQSLQKLFEGYGSNAGVFSSIHYVLVAGYTSCCRDRLEYLTLARTYLDTASSKYPISDVIFIKDQEAFWSDEMQPDDKNLPTTSLIKVRYNYPENLPRVPKNASLAVYRY